MKQRKAQLFASGLLAALASVALTACDRADDPAKPTTGSSNTQMDSAVAGNDPATSSGTTPSSSTVTGSGTAAGGTTTPGGATTASPGSMVETNPTAAGKSSGGQLSAADRTFLRTAAEGGIYEVAVARVAVEKAADPAIKSFASMLVDHHTTANEKLSQVATGAGVQLPASVPADKQKVIDKLSKASGSDFDRQFVQQVGIKDHQKDIALFEKASKDAQHPAVKEFAQSTLPTLRGHLSEAQKLPAANPG